MSSWLIEKHLGSVRQRWKWLIFGERIGIAGSVLCLAWLAIEVSAYQGILIHRWVYDILVALMVLASLAAGTVILIFTVAQREKRTWVGNALEKACPALMDRVNTLIYFEENPRLIRSFSLRSRIEKQAEMVIEKQKSASPFSSEQTLLHLGIFAFLFVAVMAFQEHYQPFKALQVDKPAETAKTPPPFELAPQKDVSETQVKKSWGQVRIVDPGHDVRLTKLDVLPLQIEMTASEAMEKPVWVTSIDGGDESAHDLAAPSDPNYMVYQPLIYLDQLQVSEWDVVSYYAKVNTATAAAYSSPLNFIEIRPFREDILKMTGSKDGKANKRYQLLSELTGLIKKQTNLIQDTHAHLETAYPQADMRKQDARKLSAGEAELSAATDQFYAKIASESENTPVGEILDELSQAGEQMTKATASLQDDVAQEGQQQEQAALTHLIACRKAFQKAISDHPDAFGGDSSDAVADQAPVTATDSLKAMNQVSEVRNRDQAAVQALHQLTGRQQALASATGVDPTTAKGQEVQLKSDLHDLMAQNPDLFHPSGAEEGAVEDNMVDAISKLSAGLKSEAKKDMARATDSMKDLEAAASRKLDAQQLTEAYKLKKIIEQNAQQLSQEKAKPGSLSNQEVQDLTKSAERSASTLKDIVNSDPHSGLGTKLNQALSDQNQQALDNALAKFGSARSGTERGAAAGEAQGDLQGISQAFEQSQPDLTNQIRGQDQLQPSKGDALDQATQELQSLILSAEGQKPKSGDEQQASLADIVHNLHVGINDEGKAGGIVHDQLLADADDLLKKIPGSGPDPTALKKLLDEIEQVRIEANDANHPKPPEINSTQIDPSKFPPAYRERLKVYFEQLSQPSH